MVVHVQSSRHLCIYNWSCSLPHSQWVAFMGSNLKVSAMISELVMNFFFQMRLYICFLSECSLFRLGHNIKDNGIFCIMSWILNYVDYIMLEVHCFLKMVKFLIVHKTTHLWKYGSTFSPLSKEEKAWLWGKLKNMKFLLWDIKSHCEIKCSNCEI